VGQRSKGRIITAIQTTQISSSYYWRATMERARATKGFRNFLQPSNSKGTLHSCTKPPNPMYTQKSRGIKVISWTKEETRQPIETTHIVKIISQITIIR
jgi:hypothetical protein